MLLLLLRSLFLLACNNNDSPSPALSPGRDVADHAGGAVREDSRRVAALREEGDPVPQPAPAAAGLLRRGRGVPRGVVVRQTAPPLSPQQPVHHHPLLLLLLLLVAVAVVVVTGGGGTTTPEADPGRLVREFCDVRPPEGTGEFQIPIVTTTAAAETTAAAAAAVVVVVIVVDADVDAVVVVVVVVVKIVVVVVVVIVVIEAAKGQSEDIGGIQRDAAARD